MDIRAEIQRLLSDSGSRHKGLVDYVVRQVGVGRHLSDVLDDPYVTNRTTPLERRALLEEPKVVDAVGDEVLSDMRARIEALLTQ
jgi:hypothetical protein